MARGVWILYLYNLYRGRETQRRNHQEPTEQLPKYYKPQDVSLVLDNCHAVCEWERCW